MAHMPLQNAYNMNHMNRGKALIFNHEQFEFGNLEPRQGSKNDAQLLIKWLSYLEFEVYLYHDPTYNDIMAIVSDAAYKDDHTNNDCILIAVLTHGNLGFFAARDSIYKFEDIWSKFTADYCPSLADKPKIFIIEACQGEKKLEGVRVQSDGGAVAMKIPTDPDFLFAYSTIPEYVSFSESYGSWYIRELCAAIQANGKSYDFVTLLTFVSRNVATFYESYHSKDNNLHDKKQIPCIMSMLTGHINFRDKRPKPEIIWTSHRTSTRFSDMRFSASQ